MNLTNKQFRIGGMTCVNCQNKIERKLRRTAGIIKVKVSYNKGTADVTYDTDLISQNGIVQVIESLDYKVLTDESGMSDFMRTSGFLAAIVVLYFILQKSGVLNLLVPGQLAESGMGYGMLFVIGLVTSVHCIAMCGGINLTQCIPTEKRLAESTEKFSILRPAILYNLGRVISYTVIGFLLGLAGMAVSGGSGAGLPTLFQGILKLIAGIFMIIMGINMLGLFPELRKWNPRMPKALADRVGKQKGKSRQPLVIGILNGFMPCGPLQSMQIVALASGNPFTGACSMFVFSLGTVPLMLGLGSIVSVLGKRFTQKVMEVGGILVVVLGLAMLSQGGSLSGLLRSDQLMGLIVALVIWGILAKIPFRGERQKTACLAAAAGILMIGCFLYNRMADPGYTEAAVLTAENPAESNGSGSGTTSGESAGAGNGTTVRESAGSGSGTTSGESAGSGSGTTAGESAGSGNEAGSDGTVREGIGEVIEGENVQVVYSTLSARSYPDITVRAGIPVRWVINAPAGSITGCNYTMYLEEYGIVYSFQEGENIIEFTPTETGTFEYCCWMGMVYGTIVVTDGDPSETSASYGTTETEQPETISFGSCCG